MNEAMREGSGGYLRFLIAAALIFLVITGFMFVSAYDRSVAPNRTFTVSGEAKATVVPDIVNFSFGVLTEGGKDLAALTKDNNDKVNRIIASLKGNNIAEKDIVTQFYNITPRYQYFSCNPPVAGTAAPCPPSEIVGYSVSQNVFVKIRDIGKAGDIVTSAVSLGANTVSGLEFTVDNPENIKNQVRKDAIAKAKEMAGAVAEAGGFGMGRLISMQESSISPQPFSIADKAVGGIGGGEAAAVEPGTQDVKVVMTLVYEIK